MTEPAAHPRIKVCCIASVAEAWTAIGAGASALGLVSAMPSGPGVIALEEIARIVAAVPPGIATFLLTSARDAATVVRQQRATGASTLQLVDEVPHGALRAIRHALPGVALVQVIHVQGPDALREARRVAPHVDALLLDSGNPGAAVKELGGTGRVHDWTMSAAIRAEANVPVWLAGGLRADNVEEAVRRVGPFGLDVCSGVRAGGVLDGDALHAFVRAAAS